MGACSARGAATEVIFGNYNVASLHVLDKVGVDVLHTVACKLLFGGGVQIPCGNNYVGVDVVPVFKNSAFYFHCVFPLIIAAQHIKLVCKPL